MRANIAGAINAPRSLAYSLCHRIARTLDAIALEDLIRDCWAKVEWGYGQILVRDCANTGWIDYMLKESQKSEFDGLLDCVIIESLNNPTADA
jgi:hypothetical protein